MSNRQMDKLSEELPPGILGMAMYLNDSIDASPTTKMLVAKDKSELSLVQEGRFIETDLAHLLP
jgi:hypothetical protein